jgi:hypothetical protein
MKPDGVAVLEGFPKAERSDIEVAGAGHVGDRQHGGDPPEAEAGGDRISHRRFSGWERPAMQDGA